MCCPTCDTRLVMSERQGIEIDYCPACRGVWLDRGELDKIVERSVPATPADGRGSAPPREIRHHDHDDRHRHHGKRRKSFLEELFD
ncbi:MAG: zf-TFIIB domain-containing protein [Sphingomonadaceae bacterium]|nr:zf-TFIIB domain-containing protein [Sphingomonadaceae bacterium]